MESIIKDINLAPSGKLKIDWVRAHMPILNEIEKEYLKTKPFAGKKVVICLHLEAKTAYMALFHNLTLRIIKRKKHHLYVQYVMDSFYFLPYPDADSILCYRKIKLLNNFLLSFYALDFKCIWHKPH